MHALPIRRYAHRLRLLGSAAVAVATILLTVGATHAPAAGVQAAVTSTTTSPAAFVPDWDGHTDSTVIEYRLVERSHVVVRVIDARGRIVASMRAGVRDAGTHFATWDGRNAAGRVQRPGRYRIRVDARPVPRPSAADGPGSAELGGSVVVAGARATTVTLQRSDVAITAVQLSRTAIGASRRASTTTARFQLSRPATVSAAMVDARGRVVRTLATRRMRAGSNTLSWSGRTTSGAAAPEGAYSLVIAATGGGRPTATSRLPLSVDRTRPKLRASSRVRARVARDTRIDVPIQVNTNEQGSVTVRAGRRAHRASVAAGSHALRVDGDRLGLRATTRTRRVRVIVSVADDAGNVAATRTTITIPPRSKASRRPAPTRPVAPTPAQPTPANPAPPVGGRWPWPVGGIITSEFGLRNGRPHQGIDIAAPSGTPIHPVLAGTVSFVGSMSGYGNTVDVTHANGMMTRYAHMSRFGGFTVGAAVTHLDTIGLVGCTGTCSGPHVHFETRRADVPQDPRGFLTPR